LNRPTSAAGAGQGSPGTAQDSWLERVAQARHDFGGAQVALQGGAGVRRARDSQVVAGLGVTDVEVAVAHIELQVVGDVHCRAGAELPGEAGVGVAVTEPTEVPLTETLVLSTWLRAKPIPAPTYGVRAMCLNRLDGCPPRRALHRGASYG
jgi:hypothetical protein